MIVIGVDPGLARVGYGIVSTDRRSLSPLAYGCIGTGPGDGPRQDRICTIYAEISRLLESFRPDELAIEQLFFSRNTTSAMQVAEVRGVILLAAGQRGIPVAEYTPNRVKQAVTGSGRADKQQVQEMIRRLLSLEKIPKPDDAADGLSIAVCHIHTRGTG
jgi:crossover junction endodeoxyribonuclease RuvC